MADKYKVEKIVLFGSRARGDHSSVSDYDIAVFGKKLTAIDMSLFCGAIAITYLPLKKGPFGL